jgi:PAS domain S-box-containing protein
VLHAAQTLEEALLELRSSSFDLVLADLWLPDSSGLDTLERIASATTCPIIVLTASNDPGMREAALAAGAYEFVQKTEFDSRVLARLVRLGAIQARTFRSLRQSEARFRSLTQLSSDWYWEQDSEFRLTFMSSHMGERTGLAASDYLGRKRWDLPALNLTEADWERHRAQLERRQPFRDFEMQRKVEGGSVWLSISGEPVYDAWAATSPPGSAARPRCSASAPRSTARPTCSSSSTCRRTGCSTSTRLPARRSATRATSSWECAPTWSSPGERSRRFAPPTRSW